MGRTACETVPELFIPTPPASGQDRCFSPSSWRALCIIRCSVGLFSSIYIINFDIRTLDCSIRSRIGRHISFLTEEAANSSIKRFSNWSTEYFFNLFDSSEFFLVIWTPALLVIRDEVFFADSKNCSNFKSDLPLVIPITGDVPGVFIGTLAVFSYGSTSVMHKDSCPSRWQTIHTSLAWFLCW